MTYYKKIIFIILIVFTTQANSLPIGFGKHQGELKYDESKSENFHIYHDDRTPNEALIIQNALEAARPVVEKWFGKKRNKSLPIITSAVSENPSFANFIVDALELQTYGQGNRDLFWHEYLHENMYLHFNNWFGPAGSAIHLFTMPAWFIEGLSEALSVSSGSDYMYSIERYQALTGKWPTYERLHNLYNSSFSSQGYATSGAFVSWILRSHNANNLPLFLNDFFHYSMPWYWPLAAIPFNSFLPLDASLENFTNKRGRELYERYKTEAEKFYKENQSKQFFANSSKSKIYLNSTGGLHTVKNSTYVFYRTEDNDELFRYKANFNLKSGWMTSSEKTKIQLPDQIGSLSYLQANEGIYTIKSIKDVKSNIGTDVIQLGIDDNAQQVYHSKGDILHLAQTSESIYYIEALTEETKLCSINKSNKSSNCILNVKLPTSLAYLGEKKSLSEKNLPYTSEVWIKSTTQGLDKNIYKILIWNLKNNKITPYNFPFGNPLSAAFTAKKNWLLVGEENRRTLVNVDNQANCKTTSQLDDLTFKISGLDNGHLILALFSGSKKSIFKIHEDNLINSPCYKFSNHNSPLTYAMTQNSIPDLKTALKSVQPWKKEFQNQKKSKKLGDLSTGILPFSKSKTFTSKPYNWNSRQILHIPLIGLNDSNSDLFNPLTYQYGFISIPLMDYLQNETVRASFLYGAESHYPNTDLTLTSTRFWPRLDFSLYRQQSWNGTFRSAEDKLYYSVYADEKGAKVASNFKFYFYKLQFSLDLGSKFSTIKRYLGPFRVREGNLTEPNIAISMTKKFINSYFVARLSSRFTLEEINENFDYNQFGIYTNFSWSPDFLSSTFSTGIDASRTRGKKMRLLREVYHPLKTFIPGSGGGYNKNNYRILGSGALFSSINGENQMRGKLNWTMPIVKDIDKLIRILYLERLDFTAFFNHGSAWYGDLMPSPEKFISAHGYNLDLQLNIKGINFNLGMGVGQVIDQDFELYMTSGFDAIF